MLAGCGAEDAQPEPETFPENVVEVLLPPTARALVPTWLLVRSPSPASDPIVALNPLRSSVPVAPIVTTVVLESALFTP